MKDRLTELVAAIDKDPAVTNVIAFTGGNGATNTANMYLQPQAADRAEDQRRLGHRAHPQEVAQIPGVNLYMQAVQDLRIGGRRAMRNINSRCRATI